MIWPHCLSGEREEITVHNKCKALTSVLLPSVIIVLVSVGG